VMATEVCWRVANGEDVGKPDVQALARHARPGRDDTTAGDGGRERRRGPGRPRGSRAAVDVVLVERPVCPVCGSAARSRYWGRNLRNCPGTDENGREYTAVLRRRCRCLVCGRVRVEKEYLRSVERMIKCAIQSKSDLTPPAPSLR